jgi:hypothetical protein
MSDALSTMDIFVSLSEAETEEELTRPIGRDRVKTVTRKEKEKPIFFRNQFLEAMTIIPMHVELRNIFYS